jgi:hypothetical protein
VISLVSTPGKIAASAITQGHIAAAGLPAPRRPSLVAIKVGGGPSSSAALHPVACVMAAFSAATALGFHHDFADRIRRL